jgi:hypothetical protein
LQTIYVEICIKIQDFFADLKMAPVPNEFGGVAKASYPGLTCLFFRP